jgi:hypothetical protein
MTLVAMTVHKSNDFFRTNRLAFDPEYIVAIMQIKIDAAQRELEKQPAGQLLRQFYIINISFKNLYHCFG